ncbi:hypothetical protein WA171_005639, partial [Blastocystis sp. BT1]
MYRFSRMQRVLISQFRRYESTIHCTGSIQRYTPEMTFHLKVGDDLHWKRTISQKLIDQFADVTCDHNPIHSSTSNGQSIAHGMLYGSMFSAMIGTHLPGTIYLKQTLQFHSPVPADTQVEAIITITRLFHSRRIAVLSTTIVSPSKKLLCSGEATISLPS